MKFHFNAQQAAEGGLANPLRFFASRLAAMLCGI